MTRPGINLKTFWSQVDKTGSGGCWIWTGCTSKPTATAGEYGKYAGRGMAHRVAYELARGPIPTGLELDHTCLVTLCINPDHLEPVTRAENMRRRMALVTHCPNNHELTPENCIGNTKRCVRCRAARIARRDEARRAARAIETRELRAS